MRKRQRERWLPVGGYENLYEVSDRGRVRNARTSRVLLAGGEGAYSVVSLYRGGKMRTHAVHRVVAAAFLGPCPPGHVVAHKDENSRNCRLENLEYATHKANIRHAVGARYAKLEVKVRERLQGHPELLAVLPDVLKAVRGRMKQHPTGDIVNYLCDDIPNYRALRRHLMPWEMAGLARYLEGEYA